MAQTILQINFTFRMSPESLDQMIRPLAATIAASDGLIWKVWLMNQGDHEAGGIYLFANAQAAASYLQGPIVAHLGQNPQITNISAKMFEVAQDLTAVTRGPLMVN
jgi:hypothetical protein